MLVGANDQNDTSEINKISGLIDAYVYLGNDIVFELEILVL